MGGAQRISLLCAAFAAEAATLPAVDAGVEHPKRKRAA